MNTKKNINFSGSLVALVTPMTSKGEVDFQSLTSLIQWHIEEGTDGLVILGTTGESSLVNDEEFLRIAQHGIEIADGKIPVVLGCGGVSTVKAVTLANRLAELKPDGFLCVTPYYVKPSQNGMVKHFTAIADATNIPVILYNVPGRTGVDLADETVKELSQHPNIVGLKDATGDVARGAKLCSTIEGFSFLSGDDETALEFVRNGGHGAISVTANVAPSQMKAWISKALTNKEEPSCCSEIFEQLMPLHKNLFIEANPIPVKWALWRMGKIENGIRPPLTWLNESNQTEVEIALKSSQVIA